MQHLNRVVLGLVMVIILVGSLALVSYGGSSAEDASLANTNNKTFSSSWKI